MERATLELEAAQALYAARLLERALYHPGPWSMRWGTIEVPAERALSTVGVSFTATFPEICWIDPPTSGVVLLCEGEVVGIRRVDHPGDTMFVVTWELAAVRPAKATL